MVQKIAVFIRLKNIDSKYHFLDYYDVSVLDYYDAMMLVLDAEHHYHFGMVKVGLIL